MIFLVTEADAGSPIDSPEKRICAVRNNSYRDIIGSVQAICRYKNSVTLTSLTRTDMPGSVDLYRLPV